MGRRAVSVAHIVDRLAAPYRNAIRLEWEPLKLRGVCDSTGAVVILEQFLDHNDEPEWRWSVHVPHVRRAALINAHFAGGKAQTQLQARIASRKALKKILSEHPQRLAAQGGR